MTKSSVFSVPTGLQLFFHCVIPVKGNRAEPHINVILVVNANTNVIDQQTTTNIFLSVKRGKVFRDAAEARGNVSIRDPGTKSSGGPPVFSLTRQRKQSPFTSIWLLKMYQRFIKCLTLICWPGDSSLLVYVWHPLSSRDSAGPCVWNKCLNKCKPYRRLWAPLQDWWPFLYSLVPTVKEMAVSLEDQVSYTRPRCLKNDVHHRTDSGWRWACWHTILHVLVQELNPN